MAGRTLPWEHFSTEELEKQYSPSMWSPNASPDSIIKVYLSKVAKDIEKFRKILAWQSYSIGSEESLELDLYGEDLPPGSPMFVFVHGGYWQELSKDDVGGLMGPLHAAGILTVVLPYTTAPKGNVAGMVDDVRRGLQKCVRLAKERNTDTIVVAGWSAGAQLVLQALSSDIEGAAEVIRGVVTISGIFDLRPLVATYVNNPLNLDRTLAYQLSPSNSGNWNALTTRLPRVRLLVATAQHDSPEFRRQATHYAQMVRSKGCREVREVVVEGADHFTIVSSLSSEDNNFLRILLDFVHLLATH